MTPTQQHPGHYWKTNDAADLPFDESGTDRPKSIRCFNMRDFLNESATLDVPVANLDLLATGIFG